MSVFIDELAVILYHSSKTHTMSRPYVICHMVASIDGRIITKNWGLKRGVPAYEKTAYTFDADAWLCGRVTMAEGFAIDKPDTLPAVTDDMDRGDFVAAHQAKSFAVAIDAHGKLGWEKGTIDGEHIISVLTEEVASEYLAYLREKGVSYIFGGKRSINFSVVLDKLGTLFPVTKILLEGGGNVNGSLLNAGLIDEISLLHYPVADGTPNTPSLFDVDEKLVKAPASQLKLLSVEKLEEDVLWLRYKVLK